MSTIEFLQKALDYIEENLKTELLVSEISRIAGFSNYHFCHLFSDVVGMPVAAYITKRRIEHAIYEMSRSGKMIDIALLYGFDTHAGFYKAFRREFGCSPSKFLKLNTAKKPQAVNLYSTNRLILGHKTLEDYVLEFFIIEWDD